jgi:hypothetical protein
MLQRTLPAGFIAPCVPTKTDKLPSGSQWLHEIKHDGLRIIARKTGAVRWNVASDVILAWIMTVPAAALFGSAFTNFINFFPNSARQSKFAK